MVLIPTENFTRTRGWNRSHWHFLFLGAAFLLLEVQNISKASVVLGNTWQVNAVIVSGVLIMALLANLLKRYKDKYPDVIRVREEIASLKDSIQKESQKVREAIGAEAELAKALKAARIGREGALAAE